MLNTEKQVDTMNKKCRNVLWRKDEGGSGRSL